MILYDRIGIPELESSKKHVAIRAVTEINKTNYKEALHYSKAVELRHSDSLASHLRYTLVDRSLLLLPVGEPPVDMNDATALWTNSKALTEGLLIDFERLWSDSIPASERIEELKSMATV